MSYQVSTPTVQSTGYVGVPITPEATVQCSLNSGMCSSAEMLGYVDGKLFLREPVSLTSGSEITRSAGDGDGPTPESSFFEIVGGDFSARGDIVFTEPGTYTFEWDLVGRSFSETVTISEPYSVDEPVVPSTVTAGVPFQPAVGATCLLDSGMCPSANVVGTIDGHLFLNEQMRLTSGSTSTFNAGVLSGDPTGDFYEVPVDTSKGELVVNEPGAYMLEWDVAGVTFSEQVTVEPAPVDASLVSGECSISSDNIYVGESVDLTVTVSNANSESVNVEVGFTFGSVTDSATVSVGSNSSADVVATFVPEEAGQITPSFDIELIG